MSVWAIVLAAGAGSRFGGSIPKQYEALAGRRVIDWSIDVARSATDGVVLVVSPDRLGDIEPGVDVVVAGGVLRSDSVRAGIAAIPEMPELVEVIVIHDGARPLASAGLYEAVIAAVRDGADGAVPGIEVTDTIKRVNGAVVIETPDRATLVAVQTPQAFGRAALSAAHSGGPDATDDAALVEANGGRVVVVRGDPANFKITRRVDLDRANEMLNKR